MPCGSEAKLLAEALPTATRQEEEVELVSSAATWHRTHTYTHTHSTHASGEHWRVAATLFLILVSSKRKLPYDADNSRSLCFFSPTTLPCQWTFLRNHTRHFFTSCSLHFSCFLVCGEKDNNTSLKKMQVTYTLYMTDMDFFTDVQYPDIQLLNSNADINHCRYL